jgi:hypothetical protein
VPAAYVVLTAGYGVLYIGTLLAASMVVFARRDFR